MQNTPEPRLPVIELRQYTLHPGQRETLIELFDRTFVEPQEALGMTVLGQFRDLDDADRFVWLRGFAGMAARAEALAAFYGGPVWQTHREAANATMLDSDNVLLLRPVAEAPPIEAWQRSAPPGHASREGGLLAIVCPLTAAPAAGFIDRFARAMAPALARSGGTPAGCYASESSANTFPRLPVREGEQVLLWMARFGALDACSQAAAELRASVPWPELTGSDATPQVLRLAPTAGSRF